jgi:hypothetical protein
LRLSGDREWIERNEGRRRDVQRPGKYDCEAATRGRALKQDRERAPCETEYVRYLDEA